MPKKKEYSGGYNPFELASDESLQRELERRFEEDGERYEVAESKRRIFFKKEWPMRIPVFCLMFVPIAMFLSIQSIIPQSIQEFHRQYIGFVLISTISILGYFLSKMFSVENKFSTEYPEDAAIIVKYETHVFFNLPPG